MNIKDLLSTYDVLFRSEGHHHCRPGWIQVNCPFCGKGSNKWHLGYNLYGGYFHCWRCGKHGLSETLSELTGQNPQAVSKMLRELSTRDNISRKEDIKPRGKLILPENLGPLQKAHRKYLRGRGFDPKDIELLWQAKGIGVSHRLGWRIFIPIHYKGEVVSWTTRSISDGGLRYISASPAEERIAHRDILYGEDYCNHAIIIHEGPLDVWATGPGAVCTFGLGYSRTQLLRMVKYPVRVVCFDTEPEAQKRARKLVTELEVFPGQTYHVTLNDAKDAAESLGKGSSSDLIALRERFLR